MAESYIVETPARRPTRAEMAARREQVAQYLREGWRVPEIARHMKLATGGLYRLIRETPGLELPRSTDPLDLCGAKGSVGESLRRQDPDFLRWIAENKADGITVADFLVSVALDAYHDEIESREGAA